MKRIYFLLAILFMPILSYCQTAIDNQDSKATLNVESSPGNMQKIDGIIAPRITGVQLASKDNLYESDQIGVFVYVTTPLNPVTVKTQNVTSVGYYYFNGTNWVSFRELSVTGGDATRFLGGTVYVRFNSTTVGNPTIDNSKVIGLGVSPSYQVGSLTLNATKGGIVFLKGNGYTISNPSQGIFDIKFDVPMDEIYGISVNILDAYGTGGQIAGGTYPVDTVPGSRLLTNDNAQVSFISNGIIRVKTGSSTGALANRPFTFLITGR